MDKVIKLLGVTWSCFIPDRSCSKRKVPHFKVFAIADLLLSDPNDLVRKGYGWMLKAASQAHQKAVFDFVMARKSRMPRVALRYAIAKMPQKLRLQANKEGGSRVHFAITVV